ncbi:hypothetical protein D3C76_1639680 [compost metagenome]
MEQSGRGYQAILLNAVYFLIIIALGWGLTRAFNEVTYFYAVIAGMNVVGMSSFLLPFMRMLKREYVESPADKDISTEGEATLPNKSYSTQT